MGNKEILDYVRNTPGNTNPSVLKGMLNSMAGQGSGTAVPVLYANENDISGELIDCTFFGENGIPPLIEVSSDQEFFAIPLSEGFAEGEDYSAEANYHMTDVIATGESGINYIAKIAEIVRQDAITVTIQEMQDGGEWTRTKHFYYSYEPSEGVYKYEP